MATINTCILNPIKVAIYDPITATTRKTFCYVGDVPRVIVNACDNYAKANSTTRNAYDKLLRDFYGSDYKHKLQLRVDKTGGIFGGYDIIRHRDLESQGIDMLTAHERTGASYEINDHDTNVGSEYTDEYTADNGDEYTDEYTGNGDEYTDEYTGNGDEYTGDNSSANNAYIAHAKSRISGGTNNPTDTTNRSTDANPTDANNPTDDNNPTDAIDEDYDDIEQLLANNPITTKSKPSRSFTNGPSNQDLKVEFRQGIEYVTDVSMFPEDKYTDVKDKIFISTGIPVYRQHLFYIYNNRLRETYRLYADGSYTVDIRTIAKSTSMIHGIPIDKNLYDLRRVVKIEAVEPFIILKNSMPADGMIYVVDLDQFIQPIYTARSSILADTYQFELLYYGFIIKYWPHLTQECFRDYMIDELELQHKYPELARNKAQLAGVYKAEAAIITSVYSNAVKADNYADTNITMAITQMIATVFGNRVLINIRNLFDKLLTSRCIPEIHAYIEYNNRKYMLRKRHIRNGSDIQFPSGSLMKNGITMAISLRKADQESFHSKNSISTMENEQSRYLFLNIWPNGKYYVKTVWNEEDELNFNDIIKVMKRFTDPIIEGINALGRYIFVTGTALSPITKNNVTYQSLNVCVFWKKVITEDTFKVIKLLWEPYLRAKIIGTRNVQQSDKYEFIFRKGMYDFDSSAIERIITASNNIALANHYAYLSNNTIKQKWDQNYDGRVMRISHRTTDIRFEVSDIRESEFVTFYQYIVNFVFDATRNEKVRASINSTKVYDNVKKLRKLREQDPELYNLKKHGSNKVYSRICQNQQQPMIYTADEIKNMSAATVKSLNQYWNFTLGRPAYYGCDNKKYPYLSFIVGVHPKHYCLPCCNKKQQMDEDSKRSKINQVCMQRHKFIDQDSVDEGNTNRHVMNYGKEIDIGRLSKLPQSSLKNLLFNTISGPGNNYYLYGVSQHIPAIENIGLIFAVAEAIGLAPTDMIVKMIADLTVNPRLIYTLLNGTMTDYFDNMEDLTLTLKNMFLELKIFSYVSHQFRQFKQWSELFTEIFYILFDISIFTFIDANGVGNAISLFVPDILKNNIVTQGDIGTSAAKYLLLLKRVNKYYPIFLIDAEKFFKTGEVDKRYYLAADKIISLMQNMVKYEFRVERLNIGKIIDLSLVRSFAADCDYTIVRGLINKRNLCYAVILAEKANPDVYIYVPVDYSTYSTDSLLRPDFTVFSATGDHKYPPGAAITAFSRINDYIRLKYTIGGGTLYSYGMLVPVAFIAVPGTPVGKICGIRIKINKIVLICHTSVSSPPQITMDEGTAVNQQLTNLPANLPDQSLAIQFNQPANLPDQSLAIQFNQPANHLPDQPPIISIPYDYNDINRCIIERAKPTIDARVTKLGESLYNNYLYQLFMVEFVNYLGSERNKEIRDKIYALIKDINIKKDTVDKVKLRALLLASYPADYALLQSQISSAHFSGDKTMLLQNIMSTAYDFDRITVVRLKSLPPSELRSELMKIANKFAVEKDLDTTNIKFPNIYMPCEEMPAGSTGYCDNKRLIVNKPIAGLVDLLADDLSDDLKSKYLIGNIWMDIAVDYLNFVKHPTEIITIYKLTE